MSDRQEKWDLRFLELSKLVASWSKDPSTQTGAVIVDSENRVISVGYNGFARGVEDLPERYADRYNIKYKIVVHCEVNAALFADRDRLKGATLYTWPFLSCGQCAAKMIQCGIKRVVSKEAEHIDLTQANDPKRWEYEFMLATTQFKEAGVDIKLYPHKMFVVDPQEEINKSIALLAKLGYGIIT